MVVQITVPAPWDIWSDQTFMEFLDKVCTIRDIFGDELLIARLDFIVTITEQTTFTILMSPNVDRSGIPEVLAIIRNIIKFLRKSSSIVFVPTRSVGNNDILTIDKECIVMLELLGNPRIIFIHDNEDIGVVRHASDTGIVLDSGVIVGKDTLCKIASELVSRIK